MGIKLIGTGSAVPKKCLTNADLEKMVDTNDQWITERTGIKTRHIAEDETLLDITSEAAQKAMAAAGVDSVDLIIVATISPDSILPNAACSLRMKLGLPGTVPAFDINSACSGFVYGVWIAEGLMHRGKYQTVLVVGADLLSRLTDWTDRGTCVLFGDGAGAAVFQYSEENGVLAMDIAGENDVNGALVYDGKIRMKGADVFKFATASLIHSLKKLSAESGVPLSEVTHFVPHQANKRIIDYAIRKLGIPEERFFVNVDKFGNTSAASVPIAIDELMRSGKVNQGDTIAAVAFGGGLTYGGILIKL